MLKTKNALIAQCLAEAAFWRNKPWSSPFMINPRWVARRMVRKARLIRVLMK